MSSKIKLIYYITFLFIICFVSFGAIAQPTSNYLNIEESIPDTLDIKIKDSLDNKVSEEQNSNLKINSSLDNEVSKESSNKIEGKIINVEASNKNGNTILTFVVTKDFSTQVKIINFPFRVIFDAPMPYRWDVPKESLEKPALIKVVSSIKYGTPDENTFRILANLKYPVSINRAFIAPSEDNNFNFVVDFRQADMLTNLLNSSTVVVPQSKEYYAMLEHNAVVDQQKNFDEKRELAISKWLDSYLKSVNYPQPILQKDKNATPKIIVVIDPGHGGKDPGAMPSPNSNIKEKDIVLNISNMIATNLLKNPDIGVVLTRRGDYFVPLKDRVLWAKKFNADLFISIHADRAPNPESSGLSVYTLSQNASDTQTQVIATNENKSDIIAGLSDDEDTEVSKILINLLQRVKINDSVTLAQTILNSAAENITLLPNPLRSAGFVVLQVPEIPSILIETGFLSNEKDIKNLSNTNYHKLVASRISNGIENYLLTSGKLRK